MSLNPLPLLTLVTMLAGTLSGAGAEKGEPEIVPADPRVPKYIFATEDTLDLPALFHMSEIEITADRLDIGDIVQKCIERENANRDEIESWTHTQIVKEVEHIDGYAERAKRKIVREQMDRVFYRKPDHHETIRLKYDEYVLEGGERKPPEDESSPDVTLSFSDLNDLPFYLEDARDYDFEILSREIVGDRVVYEVSLEPRSDFEIAPEGKIWIDTSNFQILREEFDFGERVPFPLAIKSLGPIVREREKVNGLWVWKRWIFRVQLRNGVLKTFARLTFQNVDEIPHTVEVILLFKDHLVNEVVESPPIAAGAVEG